MPTFRTAPSHNLATSIRRMLASGGSNLSPLQAAHADSMAAQTAQRMSLAEKARAEVEAMQRAEAARNDPNLAAEYAGHVAGVDAPDATRLVGAIKGQMEQPGPGDQDDAMMVGKDAQPYPMARPNLEPGQERLFRSALASTIANRLATGKTNAAQFAQSGDRINETALTNQAANEPDPTVANPIIAAVSGHLRQPFKMGAQGQVLDTETGNVDEETALAQAAAALSGARATTEGARQTELGSRSTRNASMASLDDERAAAVARGEANKGGSRQSPQQVERWVSEVARKEWETIPAKERRGMNYQQHLANVRARFKQNADGTGGTQEVADAHEAIANGADPSKVGKRFKERMGFDLPEPDDNNEE